MTVKGQQQIFGAWRGMDASARTLLVIALLSVGCSSRGSEPTAVPGLLPSGPPQHATASGLRTIVPDDLLRVSVFEAEELSGEFRVSANGEISVPLLGPVRAGGYTPRELEDSLAARLRGTYLHDPHVAVQVSEAAEQPIYVLGEVNQPGAFSSPGQTDMTVLRAISSARGLKAGAAPGRTVIIRTGADGARVRMPIDVPDVLGGRAPDVLLQANDVVYVPRSSERAIAVGLVDALLRVVTFRTVF